MSSICFGKEMQKLRGSLSGKLALEMLPQEREEGLNRLYHLSVRQHFSREAAKSVAANSLPIAITCIVARQKYLRSYTSTSFHSLYLCYSLWSNNFFIQVVHFAIWQGKERIFRTRFILLSLHSVHSGTMKKCYLYNSLIYSLFLVVQKCSLITQK